MRLLIFILFLFVNNAIAQPGCGFGIPKIVRTDFDGVDVYAVHEKSKNIVHIKSIPNGGSAILNIDYRNNKIMNDDSITTHLLFSTLCRDVNFANATSSCSIFSPEDLGKLCKQTFECKDDFMVWTLPETGGSICAEFNFDFIALFGGKPTVNLEVNFLILSDVKDYLINNVHVRPNPVSNQLKLDNPISKLTLYNSFGQKIANFDETLSTFDVSFLPPGLYIGNGLNFKNMFSTFSFVKL